MKEFNVKVVFDENGKQSAVLVFKGERKETGTRIDLTLETCAENMAAHLAKALQEYLTIRLRELKQKDSREARA